MYLPSLEVYELDFSMPESVALLDRRGDPERDESLGCRGSHSPAPVLPQTPEAVGWAASGWRVAH
jgi:hypothetical protein